jgi:hypothetical protein
MEETQPRPPGWASISELATLRGRDQAGISRRVKRLQAQGLLITRRGPRGEKLVNIDAFERAAAGDVDAVNEANGLRARDDSDPILSREQARKTAIAADLAQLELDKRLGLLLPLEDAKQAARACAERLRRAAEQMTSRAEEVASGLAKDSVFARALLEALRGDPQGARSFFKTLAREQLAELARMATAFDVATEAPRAKDLERLWPPGARPGAQTAVDTEAASA